MNIITYVNMAAEKVQATSSEDLFSRFLDRLVRKHREPGFQGVNIKIKVNVAAWPIQGPPYAVQYSLA